MNELKLKQSYLFPITVIGVLFFIFGFITWANSQLIPYLRTACELTETQSYFVGTAFFAAYFVMAIPSAYILKGVGFKKGMSVGLFVMALGAILFIPAALQRSYPLFLTGLFIIGTGLALLQTASNPYVTILGPIESAAQRISIMGICNKLAGFIAVHLLGFLILNNIQEIEDALPTMSIAEKNETLQALAAKVIEPYIYIALAFAILGVLILLIKLPEPKEETETILPLQKPNTQRSIWQHRNLVLGALAIFLYVGAEVISYDAFSTLGEALGYDKKTAAGFAQYTAIAMLVGYLLSIVLIPKYITQRQALIYSSLLSIALLLVAMFSSGELAIVAFALLGLSQSAMWPAIWPLALNKLGIHTKMGSAILVMMIVGGAVLMPLMGEFAAWIDNRQLAFGIMLPGWIYLIYYGMSGYKTRVDA